MNREKNSFFVVQALSYVYESKAIVELLKLILSMIQEIIIRHVLSKSPDTPVCCAHGHLSLNVHYMAVCSPMLYVSLHGLRRYGLEETALYFARKCYNAELYRKYGNVFENLSCEQYDHPKNHANRDYCGLRQSDTNCDP